MKKYIKVCSKCKITFETDDKSETKCCDCRGEQDLETEVEIEEETKK